MTDQCDHIDSHEITIGHQAIISYQARKINK